MNPEFIYLIVAIIMFILITVHSIVTEIKTPSEFASIGGIFGVLSQIISICICFGIFTTLTIYMPTFSWILLVLLILSAVVATGYIIRDFVTEKKYDDANKDTSSNNNEIIEEETKK